MNERPVPKHELRLGISSIIWEAYRNDPKTIKTLNFEEFVLVQSLFHLAIRDELGLLSENDEQNINLIQESGLMPYRITDITGIVDGLKRMVMGEKEIRWGKARREVQQLKRDLLASQSLKIPSSTYGNLPVSRFYRKSRTY